MWKMKFCFKRELNSNFWRAMIGFSYLIISLEFDIMRKIRKTQKKILVIPESC